MKLKNSGIAPLGIGRHKGKGKFTEFAKKNQPKVAPIFREFRSPIAINPDKIPSSGLIGKA
jgi:hypothetical protein